MAVISFSENSPDAAWVVAGWAFRQLLADVLTSHPHDSELAALFDRAKDVGYLRLDGMENPAVAVKITAAIQRRLRDGPRLLDNSVIK